MTIQEFRKMNGDKPAAVMVCQVDGSPFMGRLLNTGDMINVDLKTAFAHYKQTARVDKKEVRRWEIKDVSMTAYEATAMDEHFERSHQRENSEQPIKLSKSKK